MSDFSFQVEINRPQINIPRAMLCFAREIAYPTLDIQRYLDLLARLCQDASISIPGRLSTNERAEALSDFLFIQRRFQGNTTHYHDPRNSYLNEVLERRLGIPISLSAIYIAVAERIGLPAHGIGLPGHFIVGIAGERGEIYIDPFHGGARLLQSDLVQLVREATGFSGPFQAAWLKPIAPQAMLTRMLNNLRNVYLYQGDWRLALGVVQHLLLLQPEMPELQRDLGLIYQRLGSLRPAVQHYLTYLHQAPHAPDVEAVKASVQHITRILARLN